MSRHSARTKSRRIRSGKLGMGMGGRGNRRPFLEMLESRTLLTASPWHNLDAPLDTNDDNHVTSHDVLVIANYLNSRSGANGEGPVPPAASTFPDVNDDEIVNAADAGLVIKAIDESFAESNGAELYGTSTADGLPADPGEGGDSGGYIGEGGEPVTVAINTPPTDVDEWEVITLGGTAAGAASIDISGSGYMAIVDLIGFEQYGVQFDPQTGAWEATILFLDDGGSGADTSGENVTVTAYGGAESASATIPITVHNVAPKLSASQVAAEINEGDQVELVVTITDEGLYDGHSLSIDWGEGQPETISWPGIPVDPDLHQRIATLGIEPLMREYTFTHKYQDDNPTATPADDYVITVTAIDDDSGEDIQINTLKVSNVAPAVTVDSLTPIDRILAVDDAGNPVEWLNPGQLDESEGFVVTGTVTDPGLLDTHVVFLTIDLNSDGDTEDPEETVSPSLIEDPDMNGKWTFRHEVASVPDDGRSPGNDTSLDEIPVLAQVEDDDTGQGVNQATQVVANVPPKFLEGPKVTFDWTDNNIAIRSATITGKFQDPGLKDEHRIDIQWGDGGTGDGIENPIVLPVGTRDFSVTRSFEIPDEQGEIERPTSPYELFPIEVELSDDDLGKVVATLTPPCSDDEVNKHVSAASAPVVNYVGGRGTFDVILDDTEPKPAVFRSEFQLTWTPNKAVFWDKGVCEVGVVQIAKTVVDYQGILSPFYEVLFLGWSEWHVDSQFPYESETMNPIGEGTLSSYDAPSVFYGVPTAILKEASQDFETCVVALEGNEGIHRLDDGTEQLATLTVYGCVTWGHFIEEVNSGSYRWYRSVLTDTTPAQNRPTGAGIHYEGAGIGPSSQFIAVTTDYLNENTDI